MSAGFIGLGNLGRALAQRLISQGTQLTVWNRTPEKAENLEAEVAESPADLMSRSDIVFVCLFDSFAVRSVLTRGDGLLAGNCKGKLIVDFTTNHFLSVVAFHEQVTAVGAQYVESPVFGSVVPALKGALTIVTSGSDEARDRARLYLEQLGEHIFHLPKPGHATRMKLVNNLVLGGIMASLAEGIAIGETAQLPKDEVIKILAAAAGKSAILTAKQNKIEEEDFSPHFSVAAMHKDLHEMQDLARTAKRPMITGSAVKEVFALARAKGLEDKDFSVIYQMLKNP